MLIEVINESFALIEISKLNIGFWNHGYMCNNSWKNPPEYCDAYEGQKAGGMDNTQAVASRGGRTDVEGCW